MGKQVAPILLDAGLSVKTYHEIFRDPTLADDLWLREVSKMGLVVLSHNRDIRYDPKAKDAVMEEGGRVFILRGHVRISELAAIFVRSKRSVDRLLKKQPAPFMAVVRRAPSKADPTHTEVKVSLTREQWEKSK